METRPKGNQSSKVNESNDNKNMNSLLDLHIEENEIKLKGKNEGYGNVANNEENSVSLHILESGKPL